MMPTKRHLAALHVSDALREESGCGGGFRKVGDWDRDGRGPGRCQHPSHDPPGMIVLDPGHYEYTCPACGQVTHVSVPPKPRLLAMRPPISSASMEWVKG